MSEEDKDMAPDGNPDSVSEGRDYLDGFLSNDPDAVTKAATDTTDTTDTTDSRDSGAQNTVVQDRIIASIREIFDPEIPVNIYDLGLIYEVEVSTEGDAVVTMTLTTPHCPVAESMPGDVETQVRGVEGVASARVDLVWDPPWDPSRMTEEAQLELGFI